MADDKRLIERMKRGDQEAIRMVYMAYKDDLYTIVLSLLQDPNLAEDVLHDVFVSFTQSIRTLRIRSSLKGFLATCCMNRARDLLRKKQRQQKHEASLSPEPWHPGANLDAEKKDLTRYLYEGLLTLPVEQKQVLLLKTKADLTFRQIAEIQGVSVSTVQGRYRYGMEKLRSYFNGEVNP